MPSIGLCGKLYTVIFLGYRYEQAEGATVKQIHDKNLPYDSLRGLRVLSTGTLKREQCTDTSNSIGCILVAYLYI